MFGVVADAESGKGHVVLRSLDEGVGRAGDVEFNREDAAGVRLALEVLGVMCSRAVVR